MPKTKDAVCKFEPLKDVVCLIDPQTVQRSKLIQEPDTVRKRYVTATVAAVGPDVKAIKPGDVIYIPDGRGERYEDEDGIFLFYHEEEIPAKKQD